MLQNWINTAVGRTLVAIPGSNLEAVKLLFNQVAEYVTDDDLPAPDLTLVAARADDAGDGILSMVILESLVPIFDDLADNYPNLASI